MKMGEKINCSEVIEYLNFKCNKAFKNTGTVTRRLIQTRNAEGFTLDEFKAVIDIKCEEWNHEPQFGKDDMRQYLRPQTLFSNKFEAYLNQRPAKRANTKEIGSPY